MEICWNTSCWQFHFQTQFLLANPLQPIPGLWVHSWKLFKNRLKNWRKLFPTLFPPSSLIPFANYSPETLLPVSSVSTCISHPVCLQEISLSHNYPNHLLVHLKHKDNNTIHTSGPLVTTHAHYLSLPAIRLLEVWNSLELSAFPLPPGPTLFSSHCSKPNGSWCPVVIITVLIILIVTTDKYPSQKHARLFAP